MSPARGDFGRGELSKGILAEMVLSQDGWTSRAGDLKDESDVVVSFRTETSESDDWVLAKDDSVELEDPRSEWASVYLTVVISSSRGVRKETRFSAGNMGLDEAILRESVGLAGLLVRIEVRLWGCLYGIAAVADSLDADVSVDERVEAELGVEALLVLARLLSSDRRGLVGR